MARRPRQPVFPFAGCAAIWSLSRTASAAGTAWPLAVGVHAHSGKRRVNSLAVDTYAAPEVLSHMARSAVGKNPRVKAAIAKAREADKI